jgi:tetratricopeptide (TPR) repeat protein
MMKIKKAVKFNYRDCRKYSALGWSYLGQAKCFEAEDAFNRALRLDPANSNIYFGLAISYESRGAYPQAEEAFKQAIRLNPDNDQYYFMLGCFYLERGNFSQAEEAFKHAIRLNPKKGNVYFELGSIYQIQGRYSQAEDAFKAAEGLGYKNSRGYYAPVTINNYRKLKKILDSRGIKLVCVQYPMRDAEPLKRIFNREQGVIFVDNAKVFRDAVNRDGFKVYFNDMVGRDFGHCTDKGNQLLAENIAGVILKEAFNK